MNRNILLVTLIAALVVAGVSFTFGYTGRSKDGSTAASPTSSAPPPIDPGLAQTVARERELAAQLQADNEKLAARLQTLTASNQALTEALAAKSTPPKDKAKSPGNIFAAMMGGEEGDTNGMGGAMQKMMRAQLEQQLEGQISRMKARLQLSPDQEAQIREILKVGNERALDQTLKLMGRGPKADDLKSAPEPDSNAPKTIEEILTPDQLTQYSAMKKEELENGARLLANGQLIQMQTTLALTQEQQDKAFAVLYQQSLDDQRGSNSVPTTDPVAGLQGAMDRKLEALKGILTPDQLKTYRETQEQQMKLIQAFIPKPADSTPPPPTAVPSP